MTDMSTCISRVGYDRIPSSQPSHSNGCVGSIATNWTHISLSNTEEVQYLLRSHALDLVYIACSLVIAIHFIALIGMSLSIATHEIRDLYAPYCLAWCILTGNQVDSLRLSPGVFFSYDPLDVTDIYCHPSLSFPIFLPFTYITHYT